MPAITLKWKMEIGDTRPPEWREISEGIAREWVGESIRQGEPKTPRWKGIPGETKPP